VRVFDAAGMRELDRIAIEDLGMRRSP